MIFFPFIYKNWKERYREKPKRLGYPDIPELAGKYFSSFVILFYTDFIRIANPNGTLTNMENMHAANRNVESYPEREPNMAHRDSTFRFTLKRL